MKIVISGSTGLLGSEIMLEAKNRFINAKGFSRHPRGESNFKADLCSENDYAKIANLDFDRIIHTAAWRNPEQCEKNKDYCWKINVLATERLAKIAKEKKAFFFHISTDYVFSGDNPPYHEDSAHCPVNYYGESKAQAEEIVKRLDKYIILRIPLLYGLAAGLENSAVLKGMLDALSSEQEWGMEDSIVRFPTCAADVANAIFFLLEKNAKGIYHFSGQDKTSRYKMTVDLANILGLPSKNIIRLDEPPSSEARRPKNSQLAADKIFSMGFPPPLPFRERIASFKNILLDYLKRRKNA